jgi:hypothetical protein
VAALPGQPLLRVVRGPDVEGGEGVDAARVVDRPVAGDLRPGADADAVGLLDAAVVGKRVQGWLAVGPDALLEGAAQLGPMGLPDQVVALVVERRIQEETVVLEPEVLAGLPDAALAQRDQLLTFGERADGDRPFLESNWHVGGCVRGSERKSVPHTSVRIDGR